MTSLTSLILRKARETVGKYRALRVGGLKAMQVVTSQTLISEALAILDRAENQHRDLSDFESGRVDALLDVAGRVSLGNPRPLNEQDGLRPDRGRVQVSR